MAVLFAIFTFGKQQLQAVVRSCWFLLAFHLASVMPSSLYKHSKDIFLRKNSCVSARRCRPFAARWLVKTFFIIKFTIVLKSCSKSDLFNYLTYIVQQLTQYISMGAFDCDRPPVHRSCDRGIPAGAWIKWFWYYAGHVTSNYLADSFVTMLITCCNVIISRSLVMSRWGTSGAWTVHRVQSGAWIKWKRRTACAPAVHPARSIKCAHCQCAS